MAERASRDGDAIGRREWIAASGAMMMAACASGAVPDGSRPAATTAGSSGSGAASADRDIAELMRLASVPGMSIAAVRGADLTVEGFGVRRAGATDGASGV